MKKLKEPKTFNRPRAYIRINGKDKIKSELGFRMRIIYPDGKAEWSYGCSFPGEVEGFNIQYPCWHKNRKNRVFDIRPNSLMTAKQAVIAMKAYDKEEGYKTLFIGEF